jgi:hypothetical protein
MSTIPFDVYTISSDTDARICRIAITPIVLLLSMFKHIISEPTQRTFLFRYCKSTELTNDQFIKYLFPKFFTQFQRIAFP